MAMTSPSISSQEITESFGRKWLDVPSGVISPFCLAQQQLTTLISAPMADPHKKDAWLTQPVWPRESGRTLIHVALAPRDQVAARWEECRPTLVLENMNLGEQRLLPMVHHRLVEAGVEDPWI